MADCGCKIKPDSNFRGEVQSRSIEFCALHANVGKLRAALQHLYGFLKIMPATRLRFGDEDAVTYTMLMDAARAVLAETGVK